MQPVTGANDECSFNMVWQLKIGARYVNRCTTDVFAVSDSLYSIMLRSYNAVPGLEQVRDTSAAIIDGLQKKIAVLDTTYLGLLRLNEELRKVSLQAIDTSIQSIDKNSKELIDAAGRIESAQGHIKEAQEELKKIQLKSFLRGVAAFGAGVLVGALLQ